MKRLHQQIPILKKKKKDYFAFFKNIPLIYWMIWVFMLAEIFMSFFNVCLLRTWFLSHFSSTSGRWRNSNPHQWLVGNLPRILLGFSLCRLQPKFWREGSARSMPGAWIRSRCPAPYSIESGYLFVQFSRKGHLQWNRDVSTGMLLDFWQYHRLFR